MSYCTNRPVMNYTNRPKGMYNILNFPRESQDTNNTTRITKRGNYVRWRNFSDQNTLFVFAFILSSVRVDFSLLAIKGVVNCTCGPKSPQ